MILVSQLCEAEKYEAEKYEAFVYVWKNTTNNKKYIGYHAGSIHDGYDTSTTSDEMKEAFAKGQLVREIISVGSKQDMIALERKMLLEVDAKNSDEYYNKSNGGGKDLKGFIKPTLDQLHEKILNQEFLVDTVEKETVAAFDKFQVRFNEIDSKHLRDLKEVIDDLSGDTSGIDPIDVLSDYGGKGKHLILNGNHRITAAMMSKRAKYVKVQFIPKEFWSAFTTLELEALANRLNPVPEKRSLSVDVNDAIKFLLKRQQSGLEIQSEQNRKELISWGFTKKRVTNILNKAQKQHENVVSIPPGAVWINWPQKRKAQLENIVEQYRDKDTIAISASSAGFRLDRLLETSADFPKKSKAVVVIYHPSPAAEKQWFREYLPRHEKTIKHRVNMKIDFAYLEKIDYNAGLQNSTNNV